MLPSGAGEHLAVHRLVQAANGYAAATAGGMDEIAVPNVDPGVGDGAASVGEIEAVAGLELGRLDGHSDVDLLARGPRQADSDGLETLPYECRAVHGLVGSPAIFVGHAEVEVGGLQD